MLIVAARIGRADDAFVDQSHLRATMSGYARVGMRVDLSRLPHSERTSLSVLVEAARVMDALYLRQQWGGNG